MSLFVPDEMYLAWFLIQNVVCHRIMNGKKEGSILIYLGQKVASTFFLQFNTLLIFVLHFVFRPHIIFLSNFIFDGPELVYCCLKGTVSSGGVKVC